MIKRINVSRRIVSLALIGTMTFSLCKGTPVSANGTLEYRKTLQSDRLLPDSINFEQILENKNKKVKKLSLVADNRQKM